MSKQNRTSKKAKQTTHPSPSIGISADEWTHIIADAVVEAEEKRQLKEIEKKEAERKERRDALGYKDYSGKKTPKRQILQFINIFTALLKFCFFPRKKLRADEVTVSILQAIPALFFIAAAGISFIMFLGFGGLAIKAGIQFLWGKLLFNILKSLLFLVGVRFYFIASVEVIESEDRNYLVGLFACVTSIISIMIALVIKGK